MWEFLVDQKLDDWLAGISKFVNPADVFVTRFSGPMVKQGGFFASWKARYFLCGTRHLHYFESKKDADFFASLAIEDIERQPPSLVKLCLGTVPLLGATVTMVGERGDYEGHEHCFTITCIEKAKRATYYMSAPSHANMQAWIAHCQSAAAVRR